MRGNPLLAESALTGARSIPACAGEPVNSFPSGMTVAVYPRVCGEPFPGEGQHPDDAVYPRVCGEPATPESPGIPGWVYPRVCGGTALHYFDRYDISGLSPRVRGNPGQLRTS